VPPDPRDALGLGADGSSPWEIISEAGGQFYKSEPMVMPPDPAQKGDDDDLWQAERPLFDRVHSHGEVVDSPVRIETDMTATSATLWLAEPSTLRRTPNPDPTLVLLPARSYMRFYFRGRTKAALEHLNAIAPAIAASGHPLIGKVWITPLSLWRGSPGSISEYWVETR